MNLWICQQALWESVYGSSEPSCLATTGLDVSRVAGMNVVVTRNGDILFGRLVSWDAPWAMVLIKRWDIEVRFSDENVFLLYPADLI